MHRFWFVSLKKVRLRRSFIFVFSLVDCKIQNNFVDIEISKFNYYEYVLLS
jgi:hypothetical protein